MKAAVMGAGQWGTTFAQVLCDAGTHTELLARSAELAEAINSSLENSEYLPGIALTPDLHATGDAAGNRASGPDTRGGDEPQEATPA